MLQPEAERDGEGVAEALTLPLMEMEEEVEWVIDPEPQAETEALPLEESVTLMVKDSLALLHAVEEREGDSEADTLWLPLTDTEEEEDTVCEAV